MKYIIKREYYITEKNSWLDTKKAEWDQSFGKLLLSYHDVITDMVEELKDKYNDKDDPNDINNTIMEYMEKSFDDLKESLRTCEDSNDLSKLWNELSLNFYLWKDDMIKMSEKLDNYNSIFKLASEYFKVINRYITKKLSGEYQDSLKGESLDDKREGAIQFFEELYDSLKPRFGKIDPEEIFDMSNLSETDSDELVLNAGDEVRYYTKEDEENVALISHNQEELKDDSNVRLVSKSTGDQFEVDKSQLIEIIPKNKSLNQEVSDRLKTIKNDPDKLDKLNDYLKDMEKTDESYDGLFDDVNYRDLEVTDDMTKRWISNPDFKRNFIINMNNILKSVYQPVGHWKKYKFDGVMDLPWENRKWSILNKINTNYSAISILINEINRAIHEGNSSTPLFNFISNQFGTDKFDQEFSRFLKFLNDHKEKLFLKLSEEDGSITLNKIIDTITNISNVGDKYENIVAERLPEIISGSSDIQVPESYGQEEDMTGGIDIKFNLNGDQKTVQVKKARFVKREDDKYLVKGTSISKHYDVDYFSVCTTKLCFFFNNNNDQIEILEDGDLLIDKSILIKILEI